jgi:glycogen debranching enzyme
MNAVPDGPPGDGEKPDEPYYILAASPAADEVSRVLKQGDTFAVFDHHGDLKPGGLGDEGLFHHGTRFLSCLVIGLAGGRPLFLSSTVREDNELLAVDLTNPDILGEDRVEVPRGTLHLSRSQMLWQGALYHRLRLKNFLSSAVRTSLSLRYAADFADIFEVRGTRRPARGVALPPAVNGPTVELSYRGLDNVVRRARLTFTPRPTRLSADSARCTVVLPPQGEAVFDLVVACADGADDPPALGYDEALAASAAARRAAAAGACTLGSGNARFNDWARRSASDLHLLTTETPSGPYPYAGVPWFSTPFGRDGIITALECLWLRPGLARGVLAYLAATQATDTDPERDAQPGKILHETRGGEMAALGEIPFGRYYGSVDATPLFVVLAGAYFERTADRPFLEGLWPHVEAALGWVDKYGDLDGDGFVEYARQTPRGLANQGWKDSHDAIFHADGRLADGPIALCEVQGYVYAARRAGAALARALGDAGRADALERQAEGLRRRFESAFWCDDLSTYALALDGAKQPCRVRASNAGHALFTGIAGPERALRTAATLLAPASFSGWGVRTVAEGEARYNPMSYHDGSVWPHDNALIAVGLARYGRQADAVTVTTGIYRASQFMDLRRLPELFCGFARREGEGPTRYPVACSPQAWSAAAIYLLVQGCLGLGVTGEPRQVCFSYPVLPGFLRELRVRDLRVGAATVDLLLRRHGADVAITVLRRDGDVEIRMVK